MEKDLTETVETVKDDGHLSNIIIRVVDSDDVKNIEEELLQNPTEEKSEKSNKLDEGLLWHNRLAHASLNVSRKLHRNTESRKKAKFV